MPPVVCVAWTVLASTALVAGNGIPSAAVVVIGLLAAMLLTGLRAQAAAAAKAAIPLAIPLAVVHGFINPAFPAVAEWLGNVPVRPAGFAYAALVSLRVIAILLLGAVWSRVDAERLVDEARALRLPLPLIFTLTAASSSLTTISRQIEHVYLAQQARGIASGPGFVARLKALPTIVLPVVTASLVEAAQRGDVLALRGLGSGPLPTMAARVPSSGEWLRAATLLPVALAAVAVS